MLTRREAASCRRRRIRISRSWWGARPGVFTGRCSRFWRRWRAYRLLTTRICRKTKSWPLMLLIRWRAVWHCLRAWCAPWSSAGMSWRKAPCRDLPTPPMRRITWWARVCRSGMPTVWSAGWYCTASTKSAALKIWP